MWSQFTSALAFLTVLRLPCRSTRPLTSEDLARTFTFFPAIGMILGLVLAILFRMLLPWMSPLLLAVFLTAVYTLLTRALHLDGLADLVDGVGGGYTPQRRLEIMKDSRTGAFGAIALVLALLFKVAAISALALQARGAPLLLVPALSRYAMVLTAYKSPYARVEGGLGKAFLDHVTLREVCIATVFALVFVLSIARLYAPLYLATLLIVVLFLRRSTLRWLGGVTGDVLGAANELTEIVLFTLAATLPPL